MKTPNLILTKNAVIAVILAFGFFAAASSVSAQSPDLTFANVSRVAGKNELKITVENKGAEPAENVNVKIYALPFGFCVSPYQYEAAKSVIRSKPCAVKSSDFPTGSQLSSVELAKKRLGLAWATASVKPFDLKAGGKVEQIVKFPASIRGSIDENAPAVFPVPFVYENGMFLYAPKNLATFEASVFYAVVESVGESKAKFGNNAYLFKHAVVIKIPK